MTNAPHNDELFQNRLSEMLRGLNGDTYETDDTIEAQLDAVAAQADGMAPASEPLTDDEVSRVLQKTRDLIGRPTSPSTPQGSPALRTSDSTPKSAAPVQRSDFSSQSSRVARRVSLVGVVLALLLAAVALFEHEAPKSGPAQAVAGGPALKLSELFREGQSQVTPFQVAAPKLPDATLQIGKSISTGPRERLRVGLPDGSVAFLNADSLLVADSARRFSLPQGEAFFEVQPVEETGPRSEPFLVTAAGRTVTAVGTKFAVDANEGDEAKVVVTQGSVRLPNVEPLIAAGQEVSFDITNANDIEQVGFPAVQPSKRASETLFWTRELVSEAAPDIVPASEHRGGAITVVDPNGQEMKLSMRKFHVDVHIEDGFARTTIDQTYFNHTFSRQEGTFHFPLPPDASLSRLAMYVNGKLMEGGMVERNHGRNVYEQIRHTRRNPALLEWVDGSTFKMRVFPLEARQEKRIILSYTQRLPKNYDRTTYRFPAGHTMDGVRDWSTHLRIVDGKSNGLRWFSPSHLLRVIESPAVDEATSKEPATAAAKSDDLVLEGSQQNAAFDRDLVVELESTSKDNSFQRSALERTSGRAASPRWTTARADGAQYVLLRYQPELPAEMTRPKRNWVFVVETSADRNEVLRNAQREALRTLLDNAEHDDTFALVLAATRSSSFKAKPVFCTAKNVESALAFLDEEPSLGALDLAEALKTAERFCRSESVENWIVHIGSGVGVIGRRDEQTLRDALPPKARYAGIGVGHRWNQAFMRDAASRTGGHFTQINPDEEVSWRAFEFLSALNAPRLLDLKVTSDQKDATFLTFAETISHGQEIATIARFDSDAKLPEEITLSGTVDGEPWQQTVSLPDVPEPKNLDDASKPSHYLPRIWAKLEIDRLVADGAEQHRTAITELSKSMYVMSPFTSLLVLEDEAMYQQFNVDRGRKDHWALYPAPEKIEVVYEPGYSGPQPVDSLEKITEQLQTATDERDAAQSNLQTAEEADASTKQLGTLKSQRAVAQSKVDRLSKYRDTLQKLRDDELLNAAKPIVRRQSGWNVYLPAHQANQRYRQYFGRTQEQILGENANMRFWYFNPTVDVLGSTTPSGRSNLNGLGVPLGWRSMPLNWDDGWWPLGFSGNGTIQDSGLSAWGKRRLDQNGYILLPDHWGASSRFGTTPVTFSDDVVGRLDGLRQIALRSMVADDMVTVLPRILLSDEFAPLLVPGDFTDDGVSRYDALLFGDFSGNGLTRELVEMRQSVTNQWALQIGDRFEFERLGRRSELLGLNRQFFDSSDFVVDFATPTDGFALQQMLEQPVELVDREEIRRYRIAHSSLYRRQFAPPLYAVPSFELFEVSQPDSAKLYVSLNDPDTARDELLQFMVRGAPNAVVNGQGFVPASGVGLPDLYFSEFDFQFVPQLAAIRIPSGSRSGLIADPLERCPGMDTLAVDRRAALDAAAEKEGVIVRGTVSPEAAKLIEKARTRGWETVGVPGADNLSVVVNGAGQLRVERTLTDGLREVVLCDGQSVWHLYPDFAVGAHRDARLIANSILQSLIPWHVADAVTLSRGANVELVGEHTIRITPLINEGIAKAAKKLGREKETRLLAIELVFDAEARLIGRRLVETQSGDVLSRQEFHADGSVVSFVGDEQLDGNSKFERAACDAPILKPDEEAIVVLPLPYRAIDKLDIPALTEPATEDGKTDYSKLNRTDALKLIAAYFATGKDTGMYQMMEQCFFAKGEYPLGFATLLHSKNPREVTAIQTATSRHPNHPLSQYLRQAAEWNLSGNPAVEFQLPEDASRYLKLIAATQNIFGRWSSGAAYKDRTGTQTATTLSDDLTTIGEVENATTVWFLLKTIAEQLPNTGDAQPFLYRKLAATAAALEERPGQFVSGRVQRVKWLLKAGAGDDAAELYAEFLLREADTIAKRGGVVILDSEVHESLDRGKWRAAVRAEAKKLIGNEAPLAVVALAEACLLVEEVELADELFASVFDAEEVKSSPRLAAVALPYLTKREQHAEAERCFQTLLSQAELAANSSLWRHASTNAKALGDLDEAARRLEHALQLEFDRLPEQIDVEQFRTHYNSAFDLLAEAVADAQNTESTMSGDLAGRIRELGDRWRSIDPDATQPCFRTARLLSDMGLPFDAWDYWTSPLASVPNNSGTWSSLANELGSRQQIGRASMAWDEAFAWESTNPDYLLSHAKLLSENGQLDKAGSLLRRIAEDKWQPRFEQTTKSAAELQQALKLAK